MRAVNCFWNTEGEVRDILLALEQVYRPSFPALDLQQWSGSICTWFTHPLLDPQKSGREVLKSWDFAMLLGVRLVASCYYRILGMRFPRDVQAPHAFPSVSRRLVGLCAVRLSGRGRQGSGPV